MTRLQARLARCFAVSRLLPPVAGRTMRVVPALPPEADAVSFDVRLAAGTARLAAPRTMLRQILDALDPACMEAQLPWTALLLELAADDALAALARAHPALAVRLQPGSPHAVLPHALGLELAGATARLEMDDDAACSIAEALDAVAPQRRRPPALTATLHACALRATVGLAALRRAGPGYVILAQAPRDSGILLVAGPRLVWHARHDAGRLHITSARRAMPSGLEDEWMTEALSDETQDSGIDDLPIRLSFELGRLELSLAEIEALGPGHVFELGRSEQDAVDIMANGRRIGAGRLVLVAGVPGVQITRLGVSGTAGR